MQIAGIEGWNLLWFSTKL